ICNIMKKDWKVIVTNSPNEPWWFFAGWEKDIIAIYSFAEKQQALEKLHTLYEDFSNKYANVKNKTSTMYAFWNEDEKVYCESCADDLQVYRGLFLTYKEEPYNE